jgi:hypothetical protein
MKEKLQEYALVAEMIGGVAIVISLVFVGVQVSQTAEETATNTTAIRASAYQELTTQILNIKNLRAENLDIAELVFKDFCNENLSPIERERLSAIFINIIRHGDMAYYLFQQNLIDEERLDNALAILRYYLSNSNVAKHEWEVFGASLNLDFRTYIQSKVSLSIPKSPCEI